MNKMKTSKQVLVIEGSPRKHGNTGLLSDEFIKGAEEAGHATEKIYLSEKNIGYCVDCEVCQTEGGGCAKKDDFQKIKDKIAACDVLVLVSPVYYYSVTAQLKTLIDRTYSALTEISGKECYLIIAGAGDQEKYFQTIIDTYHGFIGCFSDMKDKGVILGLGAQAKGSIKDNPAMTQAYEAGKNS